MSVFIATRVYRCKPYLRLLSFCCGISYTNRDNCYLSRLCSAKHSAYLKISQARVMVFNIYIRYARIFFYPNAITKTRKLVLFIHSRPISNIKNRTIISDMRSFSISIFVFLLFMCLKWFKLFDKLRIIVLL